jgi:enoyl-CoA hydratase/carnithine racemase
MMAWTDPTWRHSDNAVVDEAVAVARRLARRPTRALGLLKRAIYEGWGRELSAGLQGEEDAVFSLIGSSDVSEGIRAFHEHREPVFEGR